MNGNSTFTGGRPSYASLDKQFAAYDRLPRSVRAALAGALFDWAAYPIWQRFERGSVTAKQLVKNIANWDAQQAARDQSCVWNIKPERAVRRRRQTRTGGDHG